ncbi:hypothetical protein U1Q18_013402 [Sarracenia purpurea var. burkii]
MADTTPLDTGRTPRSTEQSSTNLNKSTEQDDRIGITDPCDLPPTPSSPQIDAARFRSLLIPGPGRLKMIFDLAPTDRGNTPEGGDAVLNRRGVGILRAYGSYI